MVDFPLIASMPSRGNSQFNCKIIMTFSNLQEFPQKVFPVPKDFCP